MNSGITLNETNPLFSIITVVFNGVDTIEKTILSVINQDYKAFEYIIVDGNSNDGTLQIIEKYKIYINKLISEPDNGLYYAMNKGIQVATGKFLWFINSGDEIAAPDILSKIFSSMPLADIYYGETLVVDNSGKPLGYRRLKPPAILMWKDFKRGMLVSHQSVIVKKEIADKYDTNFKFSADYKWVLNALKKATNIVNTNMVLSVFLDGGLTKKNIIPGLKERFKIMTETFGLLPTILSHIPIGIRFVYYYIKNRRF